VMHVYERMAHIEWNFQDILIKYTYDKESSLVMH